MILICLPDISLVKNSVNFLRLPRNFGLEKVLTNFRSVWIFPWSQIYFAGYFGKLSYLCYRQVQLISEVIWPRFKQALEDMARYAGLLLAPPEGFGRVFFPLRAKKRAFYAVLAHFWQRLMSSSNLDNF